MAYTILTKKYAQSRFILPLTDDGSAYIVCRPVLATKLAEVSNKVMAEVGFDQTLAALKLPFAILSEYIADWHGLVDMNGAEIPYSSDMLKEICECDSDFAARQLERLRRIAREARLEEEKN